MSLPRMRRKSNRVERPNSKYPPKNVPVNPMTGRPHRIAGRGRGRKSLLRNDYSKPTGDKGIPKSRPTSRRSRARRRVKRHKK